MVEMCTYICMYYSLLRKMNGTVGGGFEPPKPPWCLIISYVYVNGALQRNAQQVGAVFWHSHKYKDIKSLKSSVQLKDNYNVYDASSSTNRQR